MEIWPNFFIVGAPKAGTTSLYKYLKTVPEICMSATKEPNYFSVNCAPTDHPLLRPIRNKNEYLSLFKNVKGQKIIGDASPLYLADPDAPNLIHQVSPNSKILISLRDPIERAYSHHLMHQSRGLITTSFHEQIKKEVDCGGDISNVFLILKFSFYFEDIKRFLKKFKQNQVKIVLFEEFKKNPKDVINEIFQFLKINRSVHDFKEQIHNPFQTEVPKGRISKYILENKRMKEIASKVLPYDDQKFLKKKILMKISTEKPQMLDEDRKFLIDFYCKDVAKMEFLLKRKLLWENFYD